MIALLSLSALGGPLARPAESRSVTMVVAAGRLTASARAEPLREVLAELGRATGAVIVGLGAAGDEPVSFAFADLSLADGVARILREQSFVVVLARAAGRDRLVRVSLLSPAVRRAGTAPSVQSSTVAAMERPASDSAEAGARIDSLARVARNGDAAEVRSRLEQALATDPNAWVRRAALHGLAERRLLELDVALHTARDDADSNVRAEAVRAFRLLDTEDPRVHATAAALAESDEDVTVRKVAEDLVLRTSDSRAAVKSRR